MSSRPGPASKAYFLFVIWGLSQGILAMLVWPLLAQQEFPGGTIGAALALIGGTVTSALVFGILYRAPPIPQYVGFVVVDALIPFIILIGDHVFYYGRLELPDSLTLLVALIWAAFLLPFSLCSAVVYSRIIEKDGSQWP